MNIDPKYIWIGGGVLLVSVGVFFIASYIKAEPVDKKLKTSK